MRIVYRHLPLDSLHPRARASAEAAACAEEGNKFWEYHDRLFANNRALADADLRKYAVEVGLDTAAFDECVRTRRHQAAVEADVQEAKKLGITGTPAFVRERNHDVRSEVGRRARRPDQGGARHTRRHGPASGSWPGLLGRVGLTPRRAAATLSGEVLHVRNGHE